jgi:dethiobiotin synthetase
MRADPRCEGVFVTGTDTGVGKTWVSTGLVRLLRGAGGRVAAMKPVATGCERTAAGLRNDDALLLQGAASQATDYELVNPYAFEPPIAPSIAAARAGVRIEPARIVACARALAASADCLVVEGVGGWRVPLDARHRVSDMARWLGYPVILVVGLRLGCINHARLSAEGITGDGLPFAGWIANAIDRNYAEAAETIELLCREIPAPLLGATPWGGEGKDQKPTISLGKAALAGLFPLFLRSRKP